MVNLPTIRFGREGLRLFALGIGTTWFGRHWPPDNPSYKLPTDEEIEVYLDRIFTTVKHQDAFLMIDTAASYGYSEEKIGSYFKNRQELFKKAFIATKWGEEFNIDTGMTPLDHSREHLIQSLKRSLEHLKRIDLLYIHRTSIEVLSDLEVIEELKKIRECNRGSVRYIGVSISNEDILQKAVQKNLLNWPDVLQIPASIFLKRPDLMDTICDRGINIVLNSPVRRGGSGSPEEIYSEILQHKGRFVLLTGTRRHLEDTIGYFCSAK